jgi:hypothetical protein
LNVLDLACDLANLNKRKFRDEDLYFEPFDYQSAEEVYKNLLLSCREATAQILTSFYPEKNNRVVMYDIMAAIHNSAEELLPLFYFGSRDFDDDYLRRTIDVLPSLLVKSKISYEEILGETKEVTSIENLSSLLCYDFRKAFESMVTGKFVLIKKCENPLCQKYFVVTGRSDTIYCDYPAPQNPKYKCRDKQLIQYYGLSNLEADALRLSHSIYVSLQKAFKKEKTKPKDGVNHKLEEFKKKNAEYKENVRLGLISLTEYIEWLRVYPRS